jgi:hypothetical protein
MPQPHAPRYRIIDTQLPFMASRTIAMRFLNLNLPIIFMRRYEDGNEKNPFQQKRLPNLLCGPQVSVVDRIECSLRKYLPSLNPHLTTPRHTFCNSQFLRGPKTKSMKPSRTDTHFPHRDPVETSLSLVEALTSTRDEFTSRSKNFHALW